MVEAFLEKLLHFLYLPRLHHHMTNCSLLMDRAWAKPRASISLTAQVHRFVEVLDLIEIGCMVSVYEADARWWWLNNVLLPDLTEEGFACLC